MGAKKATFRHQLLTTLAFSSIVSVCLFFGHVVAFQNWTYWFLLWNLVLAWLPVGFSWWLARRLEQTPWRSPGNLVLTLLWLGFLPNAFYIVSDLIHLSGHGGAGLLYDIVLFVSFIFNGFVLGYLSLTVVHEQLRRRLGGRLSWGLVSLVLLLCSFAIYLGRYLRWNSWDILLNPAGLIFDVSDPFVNPASHPRAFTTTLMFFILLGSIYIVSQRMVKLAQRSQQ